jgi:ribosomal protein L39E
MYLNSTVNNARMKQVMLLKENKQNQRQNGFITSKTGHALSSNYKKTMSTVV